MLDRYLLFYGRDYNSSGGWRDFLDSCEFIEEAKEKGRELVTKKCELMSEEIEWVHIVDSEIEKIVFNQHRVGDYESIEIAQKKMQEYLKVAEGFQRSLFYFVKDTGEVVVVSEGGEEED